MYLAMRIFKFIFEMQILSCRAENIEETAAHELWMKALNLMATFIFHVRKSKRTLDRTERRKDME